MASNMEELRRLSAAPMEEKDEAFGWQLVHDRPRNLVYYLHSYTGEVRWLPPRTVGFVMRGLHALPVATNSEDTLEASADDDADDDDWSPYFPHVVVTPSGLMPVHVTERGARRQASGPFNRFPLVGLGVTASGRRLLPPTWEDFGATPPFLPPYPVAVLPSSPPASVVLDESTSMPLPSTLNSTHLDASILYSGADAFTEIVTLPQRQFSIGARPADVRETKEHNRKGYLLRQTRKLMKELAMSAASSSRPSAAVHPVVASPNHASSVITDSAVGPRKPHRAVDGVYTASPAC